MSDLSKYVDQIAYLIPAEKFVFRRRDGTWNSRDFLTPNGAMQFLRSLGCNKDDAKKIVESDAFPRVLGFDFAPGQGPCFKYPDGSWWLNVYAPSTLKPEPGEYPTIRRVLGHLTRGDAEGERWLTHWIAAKVQDPLFLPLVATVIATKPHGAGKNFLVSVIEEILGPRNCAKIKRNELEASFNSRWVEKLFVCADEITSSDNLKDLDQLLKVYIASDELEVNMKHVAQHSTRNRIAWLFASNSTNPVFLEQADRRYSVFENHDPLTEDYRLAMDRCFEKNRVTKTPVFLKEIAAFYYDLLKLEVDYAFITRPYNNDARKTLIDANLQAHEIFFREVDDGLADRWLRAAEESGHYTETFRNKWDFGEDGTATQALYAAYVEFCKSRGFKYPKHCARFGAELKSHRGPNGPWKHVRVSKVMCYVVPRTPKPALAVVSKT
jgi:hypothetical protein